MRNPNNYNTRSYIMSKIKANNTKPELLVRYFLHAKGLRYRVHSKKLPGKPDIYLAKYSTVIEIRGCFWHGHDNCTLFIPPKINANWWLRKIQNTKTRDYNNEINLLSKKIKTIVIWECDLKLRKRENTLNSLYEEITGTNIHDDF